MTDFADHGFHELRRGDRAQRGGARGVDRLPLARRQGDAARGRACVPPASAWRSAGSCSPRATGTSPPKCSTRRRPRPRCRCRSRPSTTRCTSSPTSACCARSRSTARRPTSTPTPPQHHHFFVEGENALVDIPDADVIVGKTPVPPEGYEIARIDVVVRLRRKGTLKSHSPTIVGCRCPGSTPGHCRFAAPSRLANCVVGPLAPCIAAVINWR